MTDDEPELNSLSTDEAYELIEEPEERMDFIDTGEKPLDEEVVRNEEVPGDDISDELLLEDRTRADSWLHYNKGLEKVGYSPAERITTENVDQLEREYVIETDAQGMKANPIVVPGDPPIMYVSGADRFVTAVNARTGETYWEYHIPWFRPGQQQIYWVLEHGRDRGVAVWGDKVYAGTTDGYILALNRYTGEREFLGDLMWWQDLPDRLSDYPQIWAGVSAAPTVYNGMVFSGFRTDQVTWSSAQALDAETGEVVWRHENAPPSAWVENTWAFGSSATWMDPVIDPESGLVFYNAGDPSSFLNSMHRPGPNKHSISTRAFDMESGENVWNFQYLAQEIWDYDACSTATIATAEVGGEERRVLIEDGKPGWMYVLDVETGRLLMRSEPFARQEHRFGGWPESKYLNHIEFGEENAGDMIPSLSGATEWPPDAYSPRTNMRYIGGCDSVSNVYAEGNFMDLVEYGDPNNDFIAGGFGEPEFDETRSFVVALDVNSGERVWEYEFEDEDAGEWPGGPTATAGGVVFGPSAGGNLVALDDESGDLLWRDDTDARLEAAPVVWDDPNEGKQYVAMTADDRFIVYSLEA